MRIPAAHIPDELEFVGSMLVWVGMRAPGALPQRIPGAVKAVHPAVDVLAVGLVLDSSFGDTKSFSILNEG